MADKSEPGWTFRIGLRPVMTGENAAHDILVDLDAEGRGELLSHSRATPTGITPFHVDNRVDEILAWSDWTGFASSLGREQEAVLSCLQELVEVQEGGGFPYDCRTDQARSSYKQRA